MTNKEKYVNFAEKESIPIFSKPWWLDVVCGKTNWDVAIVEKGGNIMATMPYYIKKIGIFNIITMPKLTQTMGIYFKYPKGQKYYKKLSFEKEMTNKLLQQLPSYDYFLQNFHYNIDNWQPLYWQGFSQKTVYTYVIENIYLENLEKEFETDTRRRRRKAREFGVKVIESSDIKTFFELNKQTFHRQNIKMNYNFTFLEKLYKSCQERNAVKIYFAIDSEKNIIAGGFFVYDSKSVYYLMGGIDSTKKDLGGMDIILYEAIKFALNTNRKFDFEGSMVESIEKYFRTFGAKQKQLFQIFKINSKLLKIRECIKSW